MEQVTSAQSVQPESPIDKKVRETVAGIRNLPTPPLVFTQIQRVINSEKASSNDVAKILSEDPSMSAKVLKMTNSAFYGLAREINSVQQAVMVIGFDAVKNLVLSASVLGMFNGKKVDSEFQEKFWRHSLATAIASRYVAKTCRKHFDCDQEAAFSAGLLHDIGKLVIACYQPDDLEEINHGLKLDPTVNETEVEETVLGFDHTRLGSALAEHWNLSSHLVDAIRYHHNPPGSERSVSYSYPVHIANHLAKCVFDSDYEGRNKGRILPDVADKLQFDVNSIEELSDKLHEDYTHAQTFLSMAGM